MLSSSERGITGITAGRQRELGQGASAERQTGAQCARLQWGRDCWSKCGNGTKGGTGGDSMNVIRNDSPTSALTPPPTLGSRVSLSDLPSQGSRDGPQKGADI